MSSPRWLIVSAGLTLVLLAGMTIEQAGYPTPADAAPHHAAVRRAVAAIPMRIGPWVGTAVPVPPAAVKLLSPNALLSRSYHNVDNDQQVQFLVVQCRDARDMAGHYPPICYPAHGWTLQRTMAVRWQVGDLTIPAAEYVFNQGLPTRPTMIVVDNVLILPDGQMMADMGRVRQAAADYESHFFGAGQVQFVFDSATTAPQRQTIVEQFLRAALPALNAMRRGVKR